MLVISIGSALAGYVLLEGNAEACWSFIIDSTDGGLDEDIQQQLRSGLSRSALVHQVLLGLFAATIAALAGLSRYLLRQLFPRDVK